MAAPDHPTAADPGGSGETQATAQEPAQEPARAPDLPPPLPLEEGLDEVLFARTLLMSAGVGIMAVDNDGRVLFFNELLKQLFGLTDEHLRLRSSLALFTHLRPLLADAEALWEVVKNVREGQMDSWHGPIELRDGRTFELTVRMLRTERGSLGRLWVVRDITEQRRSQEALKASEASLRAVVQEQERLIATIREIGTPVLPIYNRVLVLPLVGHIESTRSAHLMDALLDAIQRHQASVVIIDITGVSLVDTSVANSLIQSMQAAALLGAHCVLVGISAAVSRTIVHLGVDLSQVTTRRDLQAGFAFALHHLGCAITVTREEPDWLSELDPDDAPKEE